MQHQQEKTAFRGILFDVDGTLYPQSLVRFRMLIALLSDALLGRMEYPASYTIRVLHSFRQIREELRLLPPGSGIEKLQYAAVAKKLGVDEKDVRKVVYEYILERPLPLLRSVADAGTLEALRRLKGKNFRLGVYSDYPAGDKLAALGLDEGIFDVVLDSTMPEIDAFKPNPRGFVYAAERMGLDPSEVIYVGDRKGVDMEGARQAGLMGALIAPRSAGKSGQWYLVARDVASLEREIIGASDGQLLVVQP